MKMRFAAVAAVLSCAAPAMAANITWTAPVDATGSVTDILNYGSIYAAARAGVSTTVNGVAFAGASGVVSGTMSFGAAPITLSGIAVGGYGPAGAAPESWDENYRTLLSTATYGLNSGSGFSTAINISGLTAGST
jgi:hypothetical protein